MAFEQIIFETSGRVALLTLNRLVPLPRLADFSSWFAIRFTICSPIYFPMLSPCALVLIAAGPSHNDRAIR